MLLLTNKLRQTPRQNLANTHALQWRPTLHFTQATTWEPQKEKVRMGEWSSKTNKQIVEQIPHKSNVKWLHKLVSSGEKESKPPPQKYT